MGKHFGAWLKSRRTELDISAYRLAALMQLSRTLIMEMEKGKRNPSQKTLHLLAIHLRSDPETLQRVLYEDSLAPEADNIVRWLEETGRLPRSSHLSYDPPSSITNEEMVVLARQYQIAVLQGNRPTLKEQAAYDYLQGRRPGQ